jgi:hypothetical protein
MAANERNDLGVIACPMTHSPITRFFLIAHPHNERCGFWYRAENFSGQRARRETALESIQIETILNSRFKLF